MRRACGGYRRPAPLLSCIALAFIKPVGPWLAFGAYPLVAIMWFIPDRRLATSSDAQKQD
jgi:hypothetical protein